MDIKLTLKLNQEIIEEAKIYASDKNISLSKLIENMLKKMTDKDSFDPEITPLVESLSGIISQKDINNEEYLDHLNKKYQ